MTPLLSAASGDGTIQSIADTHDQIILALSAIIATSIGALVYTIKNNRLGRTIANDTSQVNAAVNHKETGELSLYRLAAANSRKLDQLTEKQSEFDRKWGNLPIGIGDAVSLSDTLQSIQHQVVDIQAELRGHIAWELSTKYTQETP